MVNNVYRENSVRRTLEGSTLLLFPLSSCCCLDGVSFVHTPVHQERLFKYDLTSILSN